MITVLVIFWYRNGNQIGNGEGIKRHGWPGYDSLLPASGARVAFALWPSPVILAHEVSGVNMTQWCCAIQNSCTYLYRIQHQHKSPINLNKNVLYNIPKRRR